MQTFGERLIDARKAKGMTQEALAGAAAVTRQTISSWETGRTIPDIDTIRRLSEILGIDLVQASGETEAAPTTVDLTEAAMATGRTRRGVRTPWLIAGVAMLVCVGILCGLLLPRESTSEGGEKFDAEIYRQENPNEAGKAYISFDNRVWTENNGGTDFQMFDFTMKETNGIGFSISRIESQMATEAGDTRAFVVSAADLAKAVAPDIAPYGSVTIDGGFPADQFVQVGVTVYGKDANGASMTFYDLIEF